VQQGGAIHDRHEQIKQHEDGTATVDLGQSARAISGSFHTVDFILQGFRQERAQHRIIVNNEEGLGHGELRFWASG
jgi:hypothetical protein